MGNILKSQWFLLIGGLLFVVLGIVFIVNPIDALLSVAFYIGLIALVTGIISLSFALFNSSADGRTWRLCEGIIDVLFGLIMMTHPAFLVALIPIIIGIWVFVRGLTCLIDAFSWRRSHSQNWGSYAIIGVLLMIFGFLMIIHSYIALIPIAYLIAMIFLFVGLASLTVAYSIHRAKKGEA